MGHTPYGYRIEDGKAVVDEKTSEQVKELFSGYLAGLSLKEAAKKDIRNGDQLRGVTSLIGGFSYLRIDFDCEYTYNNINNVVDIIIGSVTTNG